MKAESSINMDFDKLREKIDFNKPNWFNGIKKRGIKLKITKMKPINGNMLEKI